jgi:hypothetical protein
MGGGLANTNAGSYNCWSCRLVEDAGVDVDVDVGGDIRGEERELGEAREVGRREGVAGTVKESRRIFVNTEKASSRRATA